jgi:mannosyltransferase
MLLPARTGGASVARTGSMPLAMSIPSEVWILAAITALGALLRFAMLATQSYWVDEAQAANELHLSFGTMLSTIGHAEPNPPLFFVVGWVWAKVFGTSEAGLRSLSAIAGTAVIPLSYLCGRELVSKRAGLLAATLVAFSPFMIWYSQEAREYMLLTAFCATSVLFFARCLRSPSRRSLAWWAVFSGLAVLTHYFAAFLVAPEAIWLVVRNRDRATWFAVIILAAVQLALLPHFLGHASHPRDWIGAFPLAIRIKQVPVALGLGSLDQSSIVNYGLIGAAVLAGALIVLLVIGADRQELRGAGVAAALAGLVLLVPLGLAVAGRDYYIARALIPAWVPLAVVIGAACSIPAARNRPVAYGGAALFAMLIAAFVYAQVRIDTHHQYQRPDWRGVAAALGSPSGTRAIVAYDGKFAEAPLNFYLRGSSVASDAPIRLDEVDVVGSSLQTPSRGLPPGVRLIGTRTIDSYRVARFAVPAGWRLDPAQLAARAGSLLGPAPAQAAVLIQGPSA